MSDPPIEFHESEYLKSLVDDETLRIVLLFFGQEFKDKLLYRGRAYVGLNHTNVRNPLEVRGNSYSVRNGLVRGTEDESVQTEDEEVYAVFV